MAVFYLVPKFSLSELPRQVSVDGKVYTLDVVETEEKRAVGLGGRESLCSACAMLFVFEKPGNHAFWMKGMNFPLDIVWLLDDTVVHIERQVAQDSEITYRPAVAANRVLEFNVGAVDTLQVGRKIEFFL